MKISSAPRLRGVDAVFYDDKANKTGLFALAERPVLNCGCRKLSFQPGGMKELIPSGKIAPALSPAQASEPGVQILLEVVHVFKADL